MRFLTLLLFLLPLDSGMKEKIVVVDHVDLVEVNHKYFESDATDPPQIKKQFVQIIFWEYRKNVLLPEKKNGENTGNWYQGSDYVVVDYFTLHNDNYGIEKINGMAPYFYKNRWYTHYYDKSDSCERIVVAKQIKITRTLYDPEHLNTIILDDSFRKELTKPDRSARMKRIPKEIEELLDIDTTPKGNNQ